MQPWKVVFLIESLSTVMGTCVTMHVIPNKPTYLN